MKYSEFRKIAKEQELYLKLIWRFGVDLEHGTEAEVMTVPARLLGLRKIVAVRSREYGFDLEVPNSPGKTSQLQVRRASHFEFSNGVLSVFQPGYRPLTDKELSKLREMEAQIQANPDISFWGIMQVLTPKYKHLWYDRRKKSDDGSQELIFDKNVRGELALKYLVFTDPQGTQLLTGN